MRQLLLKLRKEGWLRTEALDVKAAAAISYCLRDRLFLSKRLPHVTSAWDLSMVETKWKHVSLQRIAVSMQASAAFLREDQTSCFVGHPLPMDDK